MSHSPPLFPSSPYFLRLSTNPDVFPHGQPQPEPTTGKEPGPAPVPLPVDLSWP
ncbi:hypothetical protein ASPTUDRAFT_48826 [Aspergillus tubingensis CBS 134.48]|uniref:Uncharacterized protein n=1 Tax=Aspergillus tubingensis (strain CBS 134.48) TaxID=767770 RepID=A0A1L9NJF1_ASPTC|nr:hypothetical protein ASPTUDRAFT_48826 [Aspergillus tubingensis CBS 134.48]